MATLESLRAPRIDDLGGRRCPIYVAGSATHLIPARKGSARPLRRPCIARATILRPAFGTLTSAGSGKTGRSWQPTTAGPNSRKALNRDRENGTAGGEHPFSSNYAAPAVEVYKRKNRRRRSREKGGGLEAFKTNEKLILQMVWGSLHF